MSDSSLSLGLPDLLEHSSWVRALARRLAFDEAGADDLEQATWLAALRSRPRAGVPAQSWLGAILRNFARQERRARSRRAEHEARAAQGELTPPSSDVVERAELQRRLADAVMRLDEPYRTAILLRYFDGLAPREIARRTGHPIATVRTHLARGIERLRRRLDAEHGGDRRAWTAVLAPLWQRPADPMVPTLIGAALMNGKLVAAAVLVSLAAVGVWWARRERITPLAQVAEAAQPPLESAPRESVALAPESAPDARAAAETERSTAATSAAHEPIAPVTRSLRGRVLDASANPAAGVRLIARGEATASAAREIELASDQSGAFELADAPEAGVIVSADPRLVTVMRAHFRATPGAQPPVVVVAPRVDLGGRVVDDEGNALENAEVRLELPEGFRTRFSEVLDRSLALVWRAASAADGSFELDRAPQIEGTRLVAVLDGYESLAMDAPQFTDLALELVLARPRATDGYVRGRVVDAGGVPVRGARVALGVDTLSTPADGTFAFQLDDPQSFSARFGAPQDALVALKAGALPARYQPRVENGVAVWPSTVTLRLEGEPLSIAGRVVDHRGAPMQGVRVFVADATLFGAVDDRPMMVEGLLAGSEDQVWTYVESDAAGAFELGGLLDREYVVRAHDPATLLRADTEAVRAGTRSLELSLPTHELYPRVAGRVLSHGGAPIAGAAIYPMCDAFQARARGAVLGTSHDALEGTRTDAEGRFELENVPESLVYLRIEGEHILPLEYGRYVEGDSRFAHTAVRELPRERIESLEIVVELRCHLQVELRDPAAADELAVLDAAGHELVLSLFEAQGRQERERHPLHAGRSAVLGVPDTGKTVVLFLAGVEVTRAPLALDPSRLNTLRL